MREKLQNIFRWYPTSSDDLDRAEAKILSHVKQPMRRYFVDIGGGWNLDHVKLWTVELPPTATTTTEPELPLVLVHGFASGVALWSLNYDQLSRNGRRHIYAFDVLGFGKSSRPTFSFPRLRGEKLSAEERALRHTEITEQYLVDSIEKWRRKIGGPLNGKFVLLGHSLGGYIAAAYALRYPQHIAHVIFADPFGFPPDSQKDSREPNERISSARQFPFWAKAATKLFLDILTPLSLLRASGPWGPRLISNARPDIEAKFAHLNDSAAAADDCLDHHQTTEMAQQPNDDDATTDQNQLSSAENHRPKPNGMIMNYVYHCNVRRPPTGEIAFQKLIHYTAFARMPMLNRISALASHINVDFIYGSRSWVDSETGYRAQAAMSNDDRSVAVHVIDGASHHVYADRAERFNALVNDICARRDAAIDWNEIARLREAAMKDDLLISSTDIIINDHEMMGDDRANGGENENEDGGGKNKNDCGEDDEVRAKRLNERSGKNFITAKL